MREIQVFGAQFSCIYLVGKLLGNLLLQTG